MSEKTIVVEQGTCYTFTVTPKVKSNLVFHTANGNIDLEYSLKNKTFKVIGAAGGGACCATDCSAETATIAMVSLKNWHKQFPSPNTLTVQMAMYNIMLVLDSCGCKMIDVDGSNVKLTY